MEPIIIVVILSGCRLRGLKRVLKQLNWRCYSEINVSLFNTPVFRISEGDPKYRDIQTDQIIHHLGIQQNVLSRVV